MEYSDRERQQKHSRSNADYVAGLNGTASFKPHPSQLKGVEKGSNGKSLRHPSDDQLLEKDYDSLNREEQYHYQLILADFDPEQVNGYDEFKPGGFRYNHSKTYNLQVLKAKGQDDLRARVMGDYWADPSTKTGNVMLTHHQRQSSPMHIASGNSYKPKKETIYQQNAEHLGEEGLKKMAVDQLQYCQQVRQAIHLKINDPCISEKEKNDYLAKDTKLVLAINQLLKSIGEVTEQEAPQVDETEEAGFALPIGWVLGSLATATLLGTAVYALGKAIFGFVNETLNDVVDSAIDDLLRDTGVDRAGKKEPKPSSGKEPKPIPVGNGEKDDDDKPLKWNHTLAIKKVVASNGIVGMLDENKVQKNKSLDHSAHAHHPWPWFMGGKKEQPLMGIKGYVHKSVVHPLLTAFLKSRGYKVVVNQGPDFPMNRAFITRLKSDAVFKGRVMTDLLIFHSNLNQLTKPKIPSAAYYKGIKYTFDNL